MAERDLFKFDLKLEGMEDVLAALDKAEAEVMEAVAEAQQENAEDLLGKAVELAPIDTGTLRRSGEAHTERDAAGTTGVVSFNTPYAVRRHEEAPRKGIHPRYVKRGDKWVREGEYINGLGPITRSSPGVDGMKPGRKYLERPLKKYARKYVQHVADRVREVL